MGHYRVTFTLQKTNMFYICMYCIPFYIEKHFLKKGPMGNLKSFESSRTITSMPLQLLRVAEFYTWFSFKHILCTSFLWQWQLSCVNQSSEEPFFPSALTQRERELTNQSLTTGHEVTGGCCFLRELKNINESFSGGGADF